jgi:hypothetical protein
LEFFFSFTKKANFFIYLTLIYSTWIPHSSTAPGWRRVQSVRALLLSLGQHRLAQSEGSCRPTPALRASDYCHLQHIISLWQSANERNSYCQSLDDVCRLFKYFMPCFFKRCFEI